MEVLGDCDIIRFRGILSLAKFGLNKHHLFVAVLLLFAVFLQAIPY